MRRRALLTRAAAITTSLAALAGCTGFGGERTDSPSGTPSRTPSPSPTPAVARAAGDLQTVEHALDRRNAGTESELVAVDAVVENAGEEPADVTAVARFLDDEGAVLGESEADTAGIAAGGRWEVELLFGGSGGDARAVTAYRLRVERQ